MSKIYILIIIALAIVIVGVTFIVSNLSNKYSSNETDGDHINREEIHVDSNPKIETESDEDNFELVDDQFDVESDRGADDYQPLEPSSKTKEDASLNDEQAPEWRPGMEPFEESPYI